MLFYGHLHFVPAFVSSLELQITGQDDIQLCRRLCHEAAALVEDGLFQRVAGETSVARRAGVLCLSALVVAPQRFRAALGQPVALALCQHIRDVQQLIGGVVRELYLVREAAGKAAVGGQERLHLPGVARKDDHQLVAVVFHPLHQRVDGLKAEAVLLAPVEAVGLVDEEDAAQRALDDAVGQGAVWPV